MTPPGVNAKGSSSFPGHSSIKVTFELYGHLMPGAGREAVALIDRNLAAVPEGGWRARRQKEPALPST
jgi:hypothetical protein